MVRNSEVCASLGVHVVHVYCCGELGGVGVAAGITQRECTVEARAEHELGDII